ncbi:MAG: hypothetical protein IPJ10_11840 [Flavobacteriales bacterium]|nr:hypothetical protein [Flavobacteriales bacterium]
MCSGIGFSLGLTTPTAGSGVSYVWYADNGSGYAVVGGNTPTLSTSQSVATDYYCDVTCSTGPNTGSSTVISVGMNAPVTCYCTPAGTNTSYYVDAFTTTGGIQNITNTGSGYSTAGYGNFTAMTVEQAALSAVNFTTVYGVSPNTFGLKVWVDWNQNGNFTDPGEEVWASGGLNPGYATTHSGSFNVPLAATVGTTRMRIGNSYTPSTGPATPCLTNLSGEYEDYSFTVAPPPACLPPSALSANVSSSGGDLGWTENGSATAWDLEIGAFGFSPTGVPTLNDVGANPYTWGGGAANTQYDFYVRADCNSDDIDVSSWTGPFSFTTLCASFVAPYAESFTSSTPTFTPPSCWTNPLPGGGEQWRFVTTTPLTGNHPNSVPDHTTGTGALAWIDASTDVLPNELISPLIDISGLGTASAGFWFFSNADGGGAIQHTITMDVWDGSSWVNMITYAGNNANWVELSADVPGGVPSVTQFRIIGVRDPAGTSGDYFYNDLFVDDFFVIEAPTCVAPSGLTQGATTTTSLSASWAAEPSADLGYEWEIRTDPNPGIPGPALIETNTTAGLTLASTVALFPNSTYYVYVRSACTGAQPTSGWSSALVVFTGYCTPVVSYTDPLGITDVIFADVNVNANTTANGGYTDLSAVVGSVGAGDVVPLSVNVPTGYTYEMAVWIDWNSNLVFDNPAELVASLAPVSTTEQTPWLTSFTVPALQPAGTYRMRIGGIDAGSPIPCYNGAYGAFVDFGLSICDPPSDNGTVIANDNCTPPTFEVSVTADLGSGSTADIEYSVDGAAPVSTQYLTPGQLIGPFASHQTVTVSVITDEGCSVDLGAFHSACDIELDCNAPSPIQMVHCYQNNDTRTWTWVNTQPSGTVALKFNSGTMDSNDNVFFWEGAPNTTPHATVPSLTGTLTNQTVTSVGSTLSMTISDDGTNSCGDGGQASGWTFQARCGGCTEPYAEIETDLFLAGLPDEVDCNALPSPTFNAYLVVYDNGIDANTSNYAATVGYRLSVNNVADPDVTGLLGMFDNSTFNGSDNPYFLGTYPLGTDLDLIALHEDQINQSACNVAVVTDFTVGFELCPPDNDLCVNAEAIAIQPPATCPTGSITGTTVGADQTGVAPTCAVGAVQDVWYTLNTNGYSTLTWSVTAGTASIIGVELYDVCAGTSLGCFADAVGSGPFQLNVSGIYLLRYFTEIGNEGTFTACYTAEAEGLGNSCNNAIDLSLETSPYSGTTNATNLSNAFNGSCVTNTARDLHFFIDVPDGNQLSIGQTFNDYDSHHFAFYDGACPGTIELMCIDDTPSEYETLVWTNTTGITQTVYWIQDGYSTGAGNFTLEWSLAVPCAGNPNPGNTEASVAAACSGVDFTLSVQNPVELGWGYQWEYSDDGGFTWLPGATTATWLTNISVPTIFRCQVTCTSLGGGTVASNDLLMNLNPPNQCYCEPLYTYGKTSGDLLSNVVIQGTTLANNTGTAPVNPAYTYFNTLPNHTATLQAGTSYTIQATVGTYSGQDIAVWIDFDEDGVFAHPGERVGYTTTSIGSNGTGSFILALPCNPVPGVKRMRVRDVWLQAGNTIDPCATYGFGETEDYDVTISAPPACPTPSGLAASAVTTTTASLNWVTGCVETDWIVEYGVTGFTLGSGTQVPVTGTPTLGLTLLSPATPYSVYVYADCEASSPGDGQSTPFGPVNFTTAALPPANDECVNAVGLTVNTDYLCGTVTAGTVAAATASGNALGSCFGTPDNDVWYSFTATNTAHRVSLINLAGSTTDMYMKFYSGADCNSLVDFACSDPETANLTGLGIGTKYYVRVYSYFSGAATTTFNICVGTPPPPPANDDCAGAPSLPVSAGLSCTTQTSGTLESATNSGLLVSPCTGTVNNDVWYRFTATSNQHIITLSSAVPATTMYMQLFSGACGGLVHMACATTAAYTTPNTLVPTQEYYLRVYSSGSTAVTTTFNICVTTPPVGPPANDNCAGAQSVTVNAGQTCASQTFGSVFGATASGQVVTPCFGTADDDVWFSFVASGPVHTVSLNSVTGSVTSMNFNVFSGTCVGPLTNIGCGATGTAPTTTIGGLTNGSTYYVRVYTNTAVAGQNTTFNVCVTTPPVNDQCAGAIAVGCNSITSSTTVGASNLNPPATCTTTLNTAPGVWYTVQGWGGPISVSLCGATWDTKIGVFTGPCGAMTCVLGNDDFCGVQSGLTFSSTLGTTYYIYVTGYTTNSGAFNLSVQCGTNTMACAANGLTLEFQTDANPAQTTWQLWNEADDLLVLSGGPLNPANSVETNFGCVPDGCYRLRVLDSGGDGMTTGGYILRTTGSNLRIIDNKNNFNGVYDGNVSTLGSGAFCFPMDVVNQPIYSSCDKLDWVTNKFIVATEDPAVTAAYATPALRASSGYLFWFFDPNGSYSFRRFRKHSESDGYGTGALRANHFRINSWANTPSSPHLPDGVLLNVRIMGRVNWSWTTWGPACQFKMDAALAACPRVNLQDNPNLNEYSCGVNRVFGGSNDWTNRVTASQPQPVPG